MSNPALEALLRKAISAAPAFTPRAAESYRRHLPTMRAEIAELGDLDMHAFLAGAWWAYTNHGGSDIVVGMALVALTRTALGLDPITGEPA